MYRQLEYVLTIVASQGSFSNEQVLNHISMHVSQLNFQCLDYLNKQ